MSKTEKHSRQKKIISELMKARENGFIDHIDVVLEEKSVKVIYDPDATMFKHEWTDTKPLTEVSESKDLDDLPNYKSLYVTFSSSVLQKTIQKIAEYVSTTYQCKHNIYKSRVDFFEFK